MLIMGVVQTLLASDDDLAGIWRLSSARSSISRSSPTWCRTSSRYRR
jgi:hypothetical protein